MSGLLTLSKNSFRATETQRETAVVYFRLGRRRAFLPFLTNRKNTSQLLCQAFHVRKRGREGRMQEWLELLGSSFSLLSYSLFLFTPGRWQMVLRWPLSSPKRTQERQSAEASVWDQQGFVSGVAGYGLLPPAPETRLGLGRGCSRARAKAGTGGEAAPETNSPSRVSHPGL